MSDPGATCACIRLAILVFPAAIMMTGLYKQVFAAHPSEIASSLVSATDRPEPPPASVSENSQFAELFSWPFERGFGRRSIYDPPSFDPDEHQRGDIRRKLLQQLRFATPSPPVKGPLLLIVSILKQTVTLYDAGVAVAQSPISSGTVANPTPIGIFTVLEKRLWHRSNLYSGAPMPYMQRLTWDGIALHAGELPGYPASHGCIRLPDQFALRLWRSTKTGTRVVILNDDTTPTEIASLRLFAPQLDAGRKPEEDSLVAMSLENLSVPLSNNPGAITSPDAELRPGPLSILISQKDQRMYVRKGLRPFFDLPITIANNGEPFGTHFLMSTTQDEDFKSLRWLVVSIPSSLRRVSTHMPTKTQRRATAKDALDRLEISKEGVDRISALLSVGATIIITDQGYNPHTSGLDSDYMVIMR